MQQPPSDYNADSIKVLKGLEAVRKRPGMYIGDTSDGTGLHHMVFEVVDNAVDEALAGYCDDIKVIIHTDNSISVIDNGRGIPVEMHPDDELGRSTAEIVMTVLHAGGKFDSNSYKISGGLHGVGVSVVNALSEWLRLTIRRDGQVYQMEFRNGVTQSRRSRRSARPSAAAPRSTSCPAPRCSATSSSTTTSWPSACASCPSSTTASASSWWTSATARRSCSSSPAASAPSWSSSTAPRPSCTPHIFHAARERDGIGVEVAMQWNDSYQESVLCFTNNIPQRDGGTHLTALRAR